MRINLVSTEIKIESILVNIKLKLFFMGFFGFVASHDTCFSARKASCPKDSSCCLKGKFFSEVAVSMSKTDRKWDRAGFRLMLGRDWHMPSSFVFFGFFVGGGLLSSGFFQEPFYYRPCFLSSGLKLSLAMGRVMPFLGVGWSGYFQEIRRATEKEKAPFVEEAAPPRASTISAFHKRKIRSFCSFSGGVDIQVHPFYWLGIAVQVDCAHREDIAFERNQPQDPSLRMRRRMIIQALLTVKYAVPTAS
jgi:hypothetical protein